MAVIEPKPRPLPRYLARHAPNPYEGRWRWYYPALADWMIANPGGKMEDLAKHVHRNVQTVRSIVATDMFKDFLAQRREEWRERHDYAIVSKTTAVAERALDVMLDKLEKQADRIPLQRVTEIASTALDRLGYAPQSKPSVEVNVNQDNRKQQIVMVPISTAALEEARDALRAVEQLKAAAHREAIESVANEVSNELEAESKDPSVVSEARDEDERDPSP